MYNGPSKSNEPMSDRTTIANSKPVLVHIPKRMLPAIRRATGMLDTDRSKFIRLAIREKLARHGIALSSN